MDNPTGPILVYGANGGQGSAVVRAALAAGRKVRVLLREGSSHPFGGAVEIARGDMADPASLARASAGVAGVYLMIPVRADRDEIVQWGRNAIDAAVGARAGMLVFNTSGPGSRRSVGVAGLDAKREVEAYLSQADIPSVTLRATVYMDNLAQPWSAPAIVHHGVLAFVLPADQQVSWISWDEAAAYAVAALQRPDLAARKPVLQTGGLQALSGTEVAATIGRILQREIAYMQVPLEQFEAGLGASLGTRASADIANYYRWVMNPANGNPLNVDVDPLGEALPVQQSTLEQWARRIAWTQLAGAAR